MRNGHEKSNPLSLPSPKTLAPEEARAEAQRHFDHWFPNADYCLTQAKYAIRDSQPRHAAFDLHQAVDVGARYSPAYEITGEDLAWLVERLTTLQDAVAAICAERLAGPAAA